MTESRIVIKNIKTTEALRSDYDLRSKSFKMDHLPMDMQTQISVFLDGLIINNKQYKTIEAYFFDVKVLAEFLFRNKNYKSFDEIKPMDYMTFVRYLQVERKNKTATIERKNLTYKMFFAYLIEQGAVTTSPIAKSSAIKASNKKSEKIVTLKIIRKGNKADVL